jgi:hypothetical protein
MVLTVTVISSTFGSTSEKRLNDFTGKRMDTTVSYSYIAETYYILSHTRAFQPSSTVGHRPHDIHKNKLAVRNGHSATAIRTASGLPRVDLNGQGILFRSSVSKQSCAMMPLCTTLTRGEGPWDTAGRRVCACWAEQCACWAECEAAGRAGCCCVVRLSGDALIQFDGHQEFNRLVPYSDEPCNM